MDGLNWSETEMLRTWSINVNISHKFWNTDVAVITYLWQSKPGVGDIIVSPHCQEVSIRSSYTFLQLTL